jgi:hypothetical protein
MQSLNADPSGRTTSAGIEPRSFVLIARATFHVIYVDGDNTLEARMEPNRRCAISINRDHIA